MSSLCEKTRYMIQLLLESFEQSELKSFNENELLHTNIHFVFVLLISSLKWIGGLCFNVNEKWKKSFGPYRWCLNALLDLSTKIPLFNKHDSFFLWFYLYLSSLLAVRIYVEMNKTKIWQFLSCYLRYARCTQCILWLR